MGGLARKKNTNMFDILFILPSGNGCISCCCILLNMDNGVSASAIIRGTKLLSRAHDLPRVPVGRRFFCYIC
jgi:hypothetical protein